MTSSRDRRTDRWWVARIPRHVLPRGPERDTLVALTTQGVRVRPLPPKTPDSSWKIEFQSVHRDSGGRAVRLLICIPLSAFTDDPQQYARLVSSPGPLVVTPSMTFFRFLLEELEEGIDDDVRDR